MEHQKTIPSPSQKRLSRDYRYPRLVSRVYLHLCQLDKQNRFDLAVSAACEWIRQRLGVDRLPAAAMHGHPFTMDGEGRHSVTVKTTTSPGRGWFAQMHDPDPTVRGRIWIADIRLKELPDGACEFEVQLACIIPQNNTWYSRSIPAIVAKIASHGPAWMDGVPQQREPRCVTTSEQVLNLMGLLNDPERQAPIVLISLRPGSTDLSSAPLSVAEFCKVTFGATNTFVIAGEAQKILEERMGLPGETVWLFRPGARGDTPLPTEARWSKSRIKGFRAEKGGALRFLSDQVIRETALRLVD